MKEETLKDIGMSKSQIKVYLALLEIGSTKSGEVIKKTGLAGSLVYRVLGELIEKGLASFVIKSKTKYFFATEPVNIMRMWEDRKLRLSELIPDLETIRKKDDEKQEAQVFIGWKGIQTAYNSIFDSLPKGSEYIAFVTGFGERFPERVKNFFQLWHKKRFERNYNAKLIVNKGRKKSFLEMYGEFIKSHPTKYKTKIRYADDFAPEGITIFGNRVLIATFEEDKPIAVIISSEQIANSFRKTFYLMWGIAKR